MYRRHLNPAAALLAGTLLGGILSGCASTPPYQGFTTEQLYEVGVQKFAEEDWDEAVKVFDRFVLTDPTSERIVEAHMYLARAYFNRGDFLTSVTEFTTVLNRHPGHALVPEASLGVCQAYVAMSPIVPRDQLYTIQAWNACGSTGSDFAGTPVAAQARELQDQMTEKLAQKVLYNGDFYFKRKIYNSAILYFDDVLEQFPRTEAASQALLRLYESYTALEWDREAQEAKERLLRDYPDSEAARSIRGEGVGGGEPTVSASRTDPVGHGGGWVGEGL